MFTNAELSERYHVRDWDDYFDRLAASGLPVYFEGHVPVAAEGECIDGIMICRSGTITRFKALPPVEMDLDDLAVDVAGDRPLTVGSLPEPDPAIRVIRRDGDANTINAGAGSVTFSYMATAQTWHAAQHIAERLAAHLGMSGKVDLFVFHVPLEERLASGRSLFDESPMRATFLLVPMVPALAEV